MIRIACLLIGYVFGMIQTAVFYGKLKGVDIRKVGSGNAGTTNTLRVMGAKAGFTVLFGDMLKCFLAVTLVGVIFGKTHPDMVYLLKIYAAAGCILGHDFPFFLHFKGGKGIAATCGYMIALQPLFVPVFLVSFLVPFLITHFVSLGSLCLYSFFFIQLVICGQMGMFGMTQNLLNEMYFIAFLMTALAFWQHRENIRKLIHGQERKTYIFKKNKVE
ncbi:MAG: glycerol-3-phosphate 1-O-acyltransferase PlsY [Butyrivibrio sp.]|nr:glycerol-3-phosphate 1-O-acyltransferase PlsY [Butyrivibrio sp.]